ncbi:MAG: transglycosylase SLT domain-containing protein [Rhodoferax sp.]
MKNISASWLLLGSLWLTGCAAPGAHRSNDLSDTPANTLSLSAEIAFVPSRPSLPGLKPPVYSADGLRPLSATQVNAWSVHALTPPTDIWDRIRRGFAMPNLDGELVRDREQWYSSRPDYMLRMTERGRKYLFHVVEELERRNMPTELALLPFIESAFNPEAVSSASAAGMWQFMPATGKTFDLKQNMFRDDRRDVLASTRAALDYLQKLYGLFGDWHLALAAYNWGEGSVGRAIANNKRIGLDTQYTDLKMPMETRFYVPKLQAVKNIVAFPESLNVRLPLIENHPFFQTVDIKRDIDVAVAAKLAEVSLEEFRALNPSAAKPVLLAAGTPQILLPWDNAALFQSNLEAYTGGRLASWTAWIAPASLKVADAATRVGMSEAELRAVNQIPQRMLIRAGSTLLVKRSNGISTDVSTQVADFGQLSLAPEVLLTKTQVTAGKKETVASLARRYRVSAAAVSEWNNLALSASFKPRQKVTLYLPVRAASAVRTASITAKPGAPAKASRVSQINRGSRTSQVIQVSKTSQVSRSSQMKKVVASKKPAAATPKKPVRVARQ